MHGHRPQGALQEFEWDLAVQPNMQIKGPGPEYKMITEFKKVKKRSTLLRLLHNFHFHLAYPGGLTYMI